MDSRVLELLTQHMDHLVVNAAGRVECTLNGHAMPARADVLAAFVAGPKFRKLQQKARDSMALEKYEPFLVQSRNFRDKLFCALTCQLLSKSVDGVRKHMNGRRFQEAKGRYERDELELMTEPPADSEPEPNRPVTAAAERTPASDGGGDEGMWVPEEYLGHEAAARELESEAAGGGADDRAAPERSARPPSASTQPATAKRKRAAGESAAAADGRAAERRKGGAGDAGGAQRSGTAQAPVNMKKRKVQRASTGRKHAEPASDAAGEPDGEAAVKARQPRTKKLPRKADPSSKPAAATITPRSRKQSQASGLMKPGRSPDMDTQQQQQTEIQQRKPTKKKPPK